MSEVLGSKLSDKIRVEGIRLLVDQSTPTLSMQQEAMRMRTAVSTSPVFFIQNVADYYYNVVSPNADAVQKIAVANLPCIAPVYNSFFTEFKFPKGSIAGNVGLSRAGVLFETIPKDDPSVELFDRDVVEQAKWFMFGTTVVDKTGVQPVAMTTHLLPIAENGALVPDAPIKSGTVSEWVGRDVIFTDSRRETLLMNYYNNVFMPGLLALTFAHCKGSVVREEIPPEKLSKSIQKKTGHPLLRYHVIDVTPFQQVLSREGNVERVGLSQALSTVRGHFADYTKAGLFGREELKGVYWKPDHERGDPNNGIIRKDYNSNAPQ